MRTVSISMVKDECDIVELFVRHNLSRVDAMIVLDNGSSDGTREILSALVAEGIPIVVLDEPELAYRQSERTTRLFRNAVRFFDVDFVLPLDADEFLGGTDRAGLHAALSSLPEGTCGLLPWRTWVWREEDAGRHPLEAMRHRRRAEQPEFHKVLVPASVPFRDEIVIAQGNHGLWRQKQRRFFARREVPTRVLDAGWIAHFPVRSPEQLLRKIDNGWQAYRARDGAKENAEGQGYHWQEIYEQLKDGPPDPALTARVAFNYAQKRPVDAQVLPDALVEDPFVVDVAPRYEGLRPAAARVAGLAARKQPPREDSTASGAGEAVDAEPTRQRWESVLRSEARNVRTAEMHAELLYLDFPPLRFLHERLAPEDVLDLGCGSGGTVAALRRWGVRDTVAVDGFPASKTHPAADVYLQHDLRTPLDLARRFDLVINLEVVEHLEPGLENVLIDTIARHARRWVLFAGGDIGQPGIGHINCQPVAYWIECWEKRGFRPDVFASLAFRSLASFSWLRRNPLLLRRFDDPGLPSAFDCEDLLKIGGRPYPWFDQPPAIHEFPMRAPLPPAPA